MAAAADLSKVHLRNTDTLLDCVLYMQIPEYFIPLVLLHIKHYIIVLPLVAVLRAVVALLDPGSQSAHSNP